MVTLAEKLQTEMSHATLEDLFQMDRRVVETEAMLRSLKNERNRLFQDVQRQRLEHEARTAAEGSDVLDPERFDGQS